MILNQFVKVFYLVPQNHVLIVIAGKLFVELYVALERDEILELLFTLLSLLARFHQLNPFLIQEIRPDLFTKFESFLPQLRAILVMSLSAVNFVTTRNDFVLYVILLSCQRQEL